MCLSISVKYNSPQIKEIRIGIKRSSHLDFVSSVVLLQTHEVLVAVAGVGDNFVVLGASVIGRCGRSRWGCCCCRCSSRSSCSSSCCCCCRCCGCCCCCCGCSCCWWIKIRAHWCISCAASSFGIESLVGGEYVMDNLKCFDSFKIIPICTKLAEEIINILRTHTQFSMTASK